MKPFLKSAIKPEQYYTYRQATDLTGLSASTFRRKIFSEGEKIRVNGKVLIKGAALIQLRERVPPRERKKKPKEKVERKEERMEGELPFLAAMELDERISALERECARLRDEIDGMKSAIIDGLASLLVKLNVDNDGKNDQP